jgi:hypothetical protein
MGQTASAGISGDGRTPEEAVERLMAKLGPGGYEFCYGDRLQITQTVGTQPAYYETNLRMKGTRERANVQQMSSARSGEWFYRAYFSGLLC